MYHSIGKITDRENGEERIVRLARTEFDARQRDRRICTLASLRGHSWKLCYIFGQVRIRDTRWTSKWIKGIQENSEMTERKERERGAHWKLADSPIALSLSALSSFLSMPRRKNLPKFFRIPWTKRIWSECG